MFETVLLSPKSNTLTVRLALLLSMFQSSSKDLTVALLVYVPVFIALEVIFNVTVWPGFKVPIVQLLVTLL